MRTSPSDHAAPPIAPRHSRIVLAVDDDPSVRMLLRNAFVADPTVRVVTAADGEEGLLRAWDVGPSLVLADLMMPGMDGATFCRVLQAYPATAHTPIVAVSGADPDAERARALRRLCAAWVTKPFAVDDLLRAVYAWLPTASAAPIEGEWIWGSLTAREGEVAALVARGLSNAEIARVLVLEVGTIANHVARILSRLDMRSRTAIGVWVATDPRRRAAAGLA